MKMQTIVTEIESVTKMGSVEKDDDEMEIKLKKIVTKIEIVMEMGRVEKNDDEMEMKKIVLENEESCRHEGVVEKR